MKKAIVSIVLVITVVIFTACGGTKKNLSKPTPVPVFSCSASIAYDDFSAVASVERYGDGVWSAEFSEPSTLSGVRLDFSDGEVTASYKGLSFSVPKDAVPVKALISSLIEVFDESLKSDSLQGVAEDGRITVSGSLSQGDYSIVFDEKSGNLLSFEMPGSGLKMVFSDFSANASQMTTTTSVTDVTIQTTAADSTAQENTETTSVLQTSVS
ncbi:MAG: hypothetical protein IJO29_03175 [Oscillospiraceae bacterium]|nr:hypothetical protein [Oscillospiraceae bacterium]